jgi:hypothetical protein
MKILGIKIDWHEEFNQSATITCEVDRIPSMDELVFEAYPIQKGVLYYAELEGYVCYLYHQPKNEEGFGGREYSLKMKDGTIKIIKGPWSSNPESVRQIAKKRVIDVFLDWRQSSDSVFKGGSHYGECGSIVQDLFDSALKEFVPNLTMIKHYYNDRPQDGYYECIVFKDGRAKPWMDIDLNILKAIETNTPTYFEFVRKDQCPLCQCCTKEKSCPDNPKYFCKNWMDSKWRFRKDGTKYKFGEY